MDKKNIHVHFSEMSLSGAHIGANFHLHGRQGFFDF